MAKVSFGVYKIEITSPFVYGDHNIPSNSFIESKRFFSYDNKWVSGHHKDLIETKLPHEDNILHEVYSIVFYFSKIVPFLKLEPLKACFDRR